MKKAIFAFVGLLALSFVIGSEVRLASDGKALVKIALGEQAGKFDQMAAEDLQSYLGRMTGAEFEIVQEDALDGSHAIFVGETKKAGAHQAFAREEWRIASTADGDIIITGGRPIGAFFGAWRLLNHLGCYAITWDQDAIPQKTELIYDIPDEQRKPAFDGRLIYDGQPGYIKNFGDPKVQAAYQRWLLRNFGNGQQEKVPALYRNGAFYISQARQYHNLTDFVPPEQYFKEHPEYYWMNEDGVRAAPLRKGYSGSLCVSNPEVRRIALENLLEMIRNDRKNLPEDMWPTVYDMSRLDGASYVCKCPECKKIEEHEGSRIGLFYWFINQMADGVNREFPGVSIRTFASWPTNDNVPDRTLASDNVIMWICDNYHISDCFRPLVNPINVKARNNIERIAKDGKNLMIWDYWNLGGTSYFTPPRIETNFDSIQADLRYFLELGVKAAFLEASIDTNSPQNFIQLCYFTAYQLMLDPDQDPEALADVFIKHYYGPNAELMRRLFRKIRDGVAAETRLQPTDGAKRWTFCTPEFMLDAYKELDAAVKALPEGDVYRKHAEYELITFIWCVLYDKEFYETAFKASGIESDRLFDECRRYERHFLERCGGREKLIDIAYKGFEDRVNQFMLQSKIPEKFKDVIPENIKVLSYAAFIPKGNYGARVVDDKDATYGRAFCGALQKDEAHGTKTIMDKTRNWTATYFEASGAKLKLDEVPQDEQYHWFKMDGKAKFRPTATCFWGQSWYIATRSAEALHVMHNGDPRFNDWDEVWMRAKFTGPAYVPNSQKLNGIYIDLVVFTRKELPEDM